MRPQHVSFLSIPRLYIRRGDTLGSFLQSIWVSCDSIRILSTVAVVCLRSKMLPPLGHISSEAGFPTKPTWLKAVKNKQFSSWPGLTKEAIQRHFPDSDETQEGHGRRMPSSLRSTKQTQAASPADEHELDNNETNILSKQKTILFKVYDIAEEAAHKIWTDQTGCFPKQSSRGNQYIMVFVESDSSAILAEPMRYEHIKPSSID